MYIYYIYLSANRSGQKCEYLDRVCIVHSIRTLLQIFTFTPSFKKKLYDSSSLGKGKRE